MTKICKICGKEIEAKHNRKYCPGCVKQARRQYMRRYSEINRLVLRLYMRHYMRGYMQDEEHRAKHLVRLKTNNRTYTGRISAGCKCNFPGCHETENLVKHHIKYNMKGAEFCFITYCRKHHAEIHKQAN